MSPSASVSIAVQTQVLTCAPELTISEASALMRQHRSSSIIVVEGASPIGILTESDVLKIDFSSAKALSEPVRRFMSAPIHTLKENASLDEAAHEFRRLAIRHLAVVDQEGALVGMLSQSDLVRQQTADDFLYMKEVRSILPASPPLLVESTAALSTAVVQMRQCHSDHVVIVEQGEPVGLLTERDLIGVLAEGQPMPKLVDVMSKPLVCVPQGMAILTARNLMLQRRFRHLAVTDAMDKLVGVISFSNILSSIDESYISRLKQTLANRVADLQRTESDLNLAQSLINASMDGVMVTNAEGVITFVNPAFCKLTGYSIEEAIGNTPSMLKSGRQGPRFYQTLWQELQDKGCWRGEIWNRRKNGEIYPEWLTITRIQEPGSDEVCYAGIFSDITERKKSELIIENLAYYDPLTKLPNRQLLNDRMEMALATAHREGHHVAVIFIDLDHFKRINDTLGHPAGDQLLCEMANRLRANAREGDTLARLGGDELVMLLTEVEHPESAYRVVRRAMEALKHPCNIDGFELHVTASMGCSIYPEDGEDVATLLKNADTAMYRAKSDGRNKFQLYSADMNDHSIKRLQLENELRQALAEQQLSLVYQPKYAFKQAGVVGLEALIRWNNAKLGRVSPADFIPLAEDLGLIAEIGAWVLEEACRQCKTWHDAGFAVQVSVNVSPQQFKRADIIKDVGHALESSGLPPALLDLEVTESCLINEPEAVAEVLSTLRSRGSTTSMDDFGTGYSSLSLLNSIPLDNLKIDRSFIMRIPDDSSNNELVSTIVLMAHNLGLAVIAEGVETAEQLTFLRQLGCEQIQGYYFSAPLAAEAVLPFLRDQKAP